MLGSEVKDVRLSFNCNGFSPHTFQYNPDPATFKNGMVRLIAEAADI
jgi:hypothetical protein